MTTYRTRDTIGDRIRTARKDSNLTQRGLALLLGTTENHIWIWETGRSKPDYENITRLCRALHVSADWLLGLEE